ncbi:MAG TPA: GTP pyrophosphokinase [Phycisphaerae bacterium]|nr:GTP pyrophosphokinase [Phycisphaerae bacterium]
MPTLLQKAIDLAVKAHRHGEDPPGEPYILHPMRVLLAVSQADDAHQSEHLRCVAILHDTLERTDLAEKDLRAAGMPRQVIQAVKLLTHDEKTTYADYVIALKKDPLARAVKLADLMDNADLRHVTFRPAKPKDHRRTARYAASYKFLTNQLTESQYRQAMKSAE